MQSHQPDYVGADPRLYSVFSVCVIVVVLVVVWLSSYTRGDRELLMNDTLQRNAELITESMIRLDNELQLVAQLSASMVAADIDIRNSLHHVNNITKQSGVAAIPDETRYEINRQLDGYWQQLRSYRITQLYAHAAPDALVLHRAHRPDQFGDSLAAQRDLVADAYASGAVTSGLDVGRSGIGYRAVAPIAAGDGEVIGAIEVGVELVPEAWLDDRIGSRMSILVPQRPASKELDTDKWQRNDQPWMTPVQTDARVLQWLENNDLTADDLSAPFIRLTDQGRHFLLVPLPLRGYGQSPADKPLAIMIGWKDITSLVSWRETRELEATRHWFTGALMVLVALLLLMRYVDNNARARTEASLKKMHVLERKLLALYRSAPVAITLSRLDDGRLLETNPALSKLTGFSEKELRGMDYRALIPEELLEKETQARQNMRKQGRYGPISHQFIGQDGELIDVRLSGVLFEDEHGDPFIWSIIQDMRDVAAVARMKDDFISTVSHELRTPLTSIAGSLGLVLSGATGELSSKAERMLTIAHKNSQRLTTLINDLLDIEKLAAGKMTFNNLPTSLVPLLEDALEQNRSYAQQHQITLTLNYDARATVKADSGRLHQVLANLISNACKFSPAGSEVIIASEVSEGWVRVSVTDQGTGIDSASQEKLFQRFSQVHKQTSKGGTGLGLAISREIIERLDGRIGVSSEPGQGSCFWFELPVIHEQVDGLVLLVNPLGDVARHVRRQLEQNGIDTDWVTNIDDALDAMKRRHYDAMLVETLVVQRDGAAWIHSLRDDAEKAALPVVLAHTVIKKGKVSFNQPVNVFNWLTKPVDTSRLMAHLETLVATPEALGLLYIGSDTKLRTTLSKAVHEKAYYLGVTHSEEARHALDTKRFNVVIYDQTLGSSKSPQLVQLLNKQCDEVLPIILITREYGDTSFLQTNSDGVDATTLVSVERFSASLGKLTNNGVRAFQKEQQGSVLPPQGQQYER